MSTQNSVNSKLQKPETEVISRVAAAFFDLTMTTSRNLEVQASTSGNEGDTATISETEDKIEVATPKMYRVLLMNDDFTPMDFVIHVLQKFFLKPTEEATRIMLEVHTKGAGQCGTFTHEIAETKVHLVNTYAQQHRFPLKCIMEKAD